MTQEDTLKTLEAFLELDPNDAFTFTFVREGSKLNTDVRLNEFYNQARTHWPRHMKALLWVYKQLDDFETFPQTKKNLPPKIIEAFNEAGRDFKLVIQAILSGEDK